jgi:hypothetical protein
MVGGLSPEIRVAAPAYGLAPGRLSLIGAAASPLGPVSGGLIVAHLGRTVGGAVMGPAGEFRVGLRLGGSPGVVGPQAVRVEILPREPWHTTSSAVRNVFIVNMANLGALALLLPAAVVGLARRRRPRSGALDIPTSAATPSAQRAADAGPPGAIPVPTATLIEQTGPVRSVALLYVQAVRLVEKRLSVRASGEMTMREFLERTAPSLPGEAFRELTTLVERAIYSAHRPSEAEVRWAEALAAEIISDLGDGDAAG